MVLQPAATVLASLLLALPAAVPAGPDTAPAPSLRAAQSSPGQPAALAGPPGAPPGVCPTGTGYGPPLPTTSVVATKIRGGFSFLEGPVWVADRGFLLFSDMAAATGPEYVQPSTIRRFTPPATFDTFLAQRGQQRPRAHPRRAATRRGDARPAQRLDLPARQPGPQHRRGELPGPGVQLAERRRGPLGRRRLLHRPELPARQPPRPDERANQRVPRLRRPGVAGRRRLRQPNGIALSPDGTTLYVGAYCENKIYKYAVQPDGSTGPRSVFVNYVGGPDGGTIDCAGNVYWTSGGDCLVHVYSPTAPSSARSGPASHGTTNVAFGGPDRRTLFVTSGRTNDSGLYSVRLNVPGYPY